MYEPADCHQSLSDYSGKAAGMETESEGGFDIQQSG